MDGWIAGTHNTFLRIYAAPVQYPESFWNLVNWDNACMEYVRLMDQEARR